MICLQPRGVRIKEVSIRRGSTVYYFNSLFKTKLMFIQYIVIVPHISGVKRQLQLTQWYLHVLL